MIEVSEVSKTFLAGKSSAVKAVDSLSFEAEAGRVFAVLGPNGSGKTTLLRMLATLLKPDHGQVRVAGYCSVKQAEDVRRQIGFLTGSAALHKKLTPAETLEFFGGLHGLGKAELQSKVAELTEKLNLGDLMQKTVGTLSMGQKQRVMIARTLLHDPQVVVFDEATAGLDVLAAKALMQMIRDCREAGKTVLFSTHIMGEVAMVADDVMVIHHGQRRYLNSFKELQKQQREESLEEEFIRLLEGQATEEGSVV